MFVGTGLTTDRIDPLARILHIEPLGLNVASLRGSGLEDGRHIRLGQ